MATYSRCRAHHAAWRFAEYGFCTQCGERPQRSRGLCNACLQKDYRGQVLGRIHHGNEQNTDDFVRTIEVIIERMRECAPAYRQYMDGRLSFRMTAVIEAQALLHIIRRGLTVNQRVYVLRRVNDHLPLGCHLDIGTLIFREDVDESKDDTPAAASGDDEAAASG